MKNGGVTQFFWNCPNLTFEASASLKSLGETELATAYDKCLEVLIGKSVDWLQLREQSSNNPSEFWEQFHASYDLLDLTWFDDAYFATYGQSLTTRLVSYVKSNKGEFIES